MRLFFGFPLSEETSNYLAEKIDYLRDYIPFGVNWVKRENLHITLQFLGQVASNRLKDLYDMFLHLIEDIGKQVFKEAELTVYPLDEPKLIWVSLKHSKELKKLVKKLRFQLAEMGINVEKRDFKAHITLGRIKNPLMKPHIRTIYECDFELDNINVEEVVLFESNFTKSGVKYRNLNNYNL
jgi:2'-5' RNA ligase